MQADARARRDETTRHGNAREEIRGWLKSLFFALALVLIFRAHIAEGYQIRGASMEPTLKNDDRLFVEKVTPRFRPYRPGDIIVFPHPREGKKLIKRIAAVGGQAVEIRDGALWIDGERQVESYLREEDWARAEKDFGKVPDGKLFLLGDNRRRSNDSRSFDSDRYIAEKVVVGRAFVRFWPVGRFRFFPWPGDDP